MLQRFIRNAENAFKRARLILFPVRLNVWLKLGFLCWMAGAIPSFFNLPPLNPQKTAVEAPSVDLTANNGERPLEMKKGQIVQEVSKGVGIVKTLWIENRSSFLLIAGSALFFLFVILAFFVWLGSRLSLVLVACLESGEVLIGHAFRATSKMGESFFRFNFYSALVLFLGFVGGVYFSFLSVLKLGVFSPSYNPLKVILDLILILLPFVFIFILVAGFIYLLNRFLPVVMMTYSCYVPAALNWMFRWALRNPLRMVANLFFYFVLSSLLSIAVSMATAMLLFVLGLPFVFLGMAGAILAKGSFLLGKIGIGILVFFGSILMMTIAFLILVPVEIYLTYLRLEMVKAEKGPSLT